MSSITTRAAKGSALTHAEVDANFTNLNSGKAEVSGQTFTGAVVLPAGSATAGGVQVGTGATYKPSIYSPGTDQLAISTGGVGRLYVNSSGNVGIGTSAPQSPLQVLNQIRVSDSTQAQGSIVLGDGGSTAFNVGIARWNGATNAAGAGGVGYFSQGTGNSGGHFFYTGDAAAGSQTERARFDSSGRLLVGTSTARSNFYNTVYTPQFQIEGLGQQQSMLSLVCSLAGNECPVIVMGKQRSGTIGGNTVANSGDIIGSLSFQGADGSELVETASIQAYVDGTPGANDMPGRLVFSTTADGAASPTERMRITNNGSVLTNTTSAYSASVCTTDFNSASQFGLTLRDTGSATDAVMMYFYKSGNVRGNITTTATATAFNTSSDYRLKRDVVPIENASSRVQQLQPVNFAWEETGSRCDGFLAHEAQAVVPECVTGEKDAVDEDGNPVYQSIDQSKLVPLLTAALQEAIARIETLETRLSALEGA
jgi:hypothetical protein